jgi:hypothetical protein
MVVGPSSAGLLTAVTAGIFGMATSSINFGTARVRPNNAILSLPGSQADSTTIRSGFPWICQAIFDVNGNFR